MNMNPSSYTESWGQYRLSQDPEKLAELYDYAASLPELIEMLFMDTDFSDSGVAQELNFHGYKDPQGNRWQPSAVKAARKRWMSDLPVMPSVPAEETPVPEVGPVPEVKPKRVRKKKITGSDAGLWMTSGKYRTGH